MHREQPAAPTAVALRLVLPEIRWVAVRRARLRLAWLGLLALACAAAPAPDPPPEGPRTVVMISLDGMRPADAAHLAAARWIAERGALAERLVPAFPTNTFPNHVTLVTGVAPDTHGVVANTFLDPERGVFRYEADPTWIEVEPLWSLLGAAGVVSASYHWVGSEGAWRSGRGPRHFEPFDPDTPEADKVERILAWLDLADPAERPRFVTCWFRGADRAGHRHGPGSPQVVAALRGQDAALLRLVEGIEARGLWGATTLLLVSDHGMADVVRSVDLQRALDAAGSGARVLGGGGIVTVSLAGGALPLARALEVARGLGLEAWPRPALPADLAAPHPRFGDLVVLAPVGTAIVRHEPDRPAVIEGAAAALPLRGSHGYRAERPEMDALFAAVGRDVAAGSRPGSVRAVDVAPTVLTWLGVEAPPWMQGRALDLSGGGTP